MGYEDGLRNRLKWAALLLVLVLVSGCTRPATRIPQATSPKSTAPPSSHTDPAPGQSENPPASTQTSIAEITHTPGEPSPTAPTRPVRDEATVQVLSLTGPASEPDAEFSGLAWVGETLVLLPQHPERFEENGSAALFSLSKSNILAAIHGETALPLQPARLPIHLAGLEDSLPGYDGFEAIAFSGDRVYLTIETRLDTSSAYLVTGYVAADLSSISLIPISPAPVAPQADLINFSDEAVLVFGRRLMTFYEANGAAVNPNAAAHLFDLNSNLLDQIDMVNVEYRITDVTPPDENGRFWAINYFYPGETFLLPTADPIAEEFGEGASHLRYSTVERLLEFQIGESGISLTGSPPIYLELIDDDHSRNWEGIARLDQTGFLLVTDQYPETILGYVAYP